MFSGTVEDSAGELVKIVSTQRDSQVEPLDLPAGVNKPPRRRFYYWFVRMSSARGCGPKSAVEHAATTRMFGRGDAAFLPQFNQFSSFGWKSSRRMARERALV